MNEVRHEYGAPCTNNVRNPSRWARMVRERKMDLTREPDPKGDRVKIVMSGKYLQYKTY